VRATAAATLVLFRPTAMRFLRQGKGVQKDENEKKLSGHECPRQPGVFDAPLTWLSLVELLASRARLRFPRQSNYNTRRENDGRYGCIGPSSSEEEALADAKASLKLPMDSASLAERFF